jgi:2,3-dihydroxy-p-cumate/2,3-dihydroxybenzoate 3,4-dioxygenase
MLPQFRYHKLGYAALLVTNLERSIRFYRDLVGLELVARDDDTAYLRCSGDHHNLILHTSPTAGIRSVGYQLESPEDLDKAYDFHAANGLNPNWVADGRPYGSVQGRTYRVREPRSGLMFELYDRMEFQAVPYQHTVTRIARIGHVVVATPDYEESRATMSSLFNFALSDIVDGKFAWMRCYPNPLHHSFAVGRSETAHLHHVNFMVTDIDDIGHAASRMREAGVPIVFGPGRHLPSTSIFLYFLDPDGLTIEFSFGMEEIHEASPRQPRMLEMHPRTMDIWGSAPDPRFGRAGCIE